MSIRELQESITLINPLILFRLPLFSTSWLSTERKTAETESNLLFCKMYFQDMQYETLLMLFSPLCFSFIQRFVWGLDKMPLFSVGVPEMHTSPCWSGADRSSSHRVMCSSSKTSARTRTTSMNPLKDGWSWETHPWWMEMFLWLWGTSASAIQELMSVRLQPAAPEMARESSKSSSTPSTSQSQSLVSLQRFSLLRLQHWLQQCLWRSALDFWSVAFFTCSEGLWRQFYQSLFGKGEFCICVTENSKKNTDRVLNVFPLVRGIFIQKINTIK